MTGGGRKRLVGLREVSGVVMMEVAVAVLLAGIAVSGLATATQRAVSAALTAREEVSAAAVTAWEETRVSEWGWGPMVREAEWSPGPCLELSFYIPSAESGVVGVWSDGWLLGEWPAAGNLVREIAQEVWADRTGEAVTVRARAQGDGWGPPWRTIVPDVYGQILGSPLEQTPVAEPLDDSEQPRVAVHVPSLARPIMLGTWSVEPIQETLGGLVYLPSAPLQETVGVTLDGRTQWWKSRDENMLDVYF